jgi:hypothetical protein
MNCRGYLHRRSPEALRKAVQKRSGGTFSDTRTIFFRKDAQQKVV